MGARGNSGVILAQILRGLAQGLKGKGSFNGSDLAAALAQSSSLAYKAVSQPVEGTILTVIREAAAAAQARSCSDDSDLLSIMEGLVDEARASVARTPSLLPLLRQAGVVDAGGQGLYVLFEGALRHLRGEEALEAAPSPHSSALAMQKQAEEPFYGYCTEFLLQGHGLDLEQVRESLGKLGESVLVVGDETMVRAHLHTMDPGAALSYATSLGVLRQVKVDNMQEQHRHFIAQIEKPLQPVAENRGNRIDQVLLFGQIEGLVLDVEDVVAAVVSGHERLGQPHPQARVERGRRRCVPLTDPASDLGLAKLKACDFTAYHSPISRVEGKQLPSLVVTARLEVFVD
jgi:dihydroxyacetone kinase-like predicted kinase